MSAAEQERVARLALSLLTEPGDPRMAALVAQLGAVRVHAHLADQRDLAGLRDDVAARLANIDAAAVLDRGRADGYRFVVPGDEEWPDGVDDLATCTPLQDRGGAPLGLWLRGRQRLDRLTDGLAVVGSRSATSYGASVAGDIAAAVGREHLCVVSGAAFGIDQAAHRGALAVGAPTVAVLACGVDRPYPTAHRNLIDHIAEHGLVVSELAPGCAPTRLRFLARNRLIAALTRGTVVVEAAVRSGALNTANWAERLGRLLMAVPGPVTSAASQGAHQLIRDQRAVLVTGGGDVLDQVGRAGEHLVDVPRAPARPRDRLRTRDAQVLDAVPAVRPASVDSIARTAGVGLVDAQRVLDRLLRDGLVARTEDGWSLTTAGRA